MKTSPVGLDFFILSRKISLAEIGRKLEGVSEQQFLVNDVGLSPLIFLSFLLGKSKKAHDRILWFGFKESCVRVEPELGS